MSVKAGRVAILWQRFGPYHLARLRGASACFDSVIGIEVAAQDHYAWAKHDSAQTQFEHQTLFSDVPYEALPRKTIRQSVAGCLSKLKPEVVAINGWSVPEALAALKWCIANRCPAILMSETFLSSGNFLKEAIKSFRVRKFNAALVGGRWHQEYLFKLGFPKKRIQLGYDAVDNQHFKEGARRARESATEMRSKHQLPDNYFFANTRFLVRKKIDVLLRAFAQYAKQVDSPASLVISGSGECEHEWKQLAKQLSIESWVTWPGFVQYDELPVYYGLAKAFVHIASREAWGLVVNEAAASGLPIIVGKAVGSSCELVEPSNGYLVDPEREETVVEALCDLSRLTPGQHAKMVAHSQALASQYDIDRFGAGLRAATDSTL